MRLLIVGGSAYSTPSLFAALPPQPEAEPLDVTLAGRSASRLDAVRDAIEIVSTVPCSIRTTTLETDDFREAARDANVILIQARIGGYRARAYDEAFPLSSGICGDEGLGPGGLAAAWRTWPFLSDLLQTVEANGSQARMLLMTAPLGLLIRCARVARPSADLVGICELPWVTLRDIVARTSANLRTTRFEYAGVNHLGWFTRIADGSRDIVSAYRETRAPGIFPSPALIDMARAIPLKYLRLHYEGEAVVAEQRAGRPRALELEEFQQSAFVDFQTRRPENIRAALNRRPTGWYADAIAHVLSPTVRDGFAPVLFLTTSNDGYLDWLADDDVVEVPFAVTSDGLQRNPSPQDVPAHVRETLDRLVRYEAAAAAAVAARDPAMIADALALHPWVPNTATARSLAARVTDDSAGGDSLHVIGKHVGKAFT